MNNEIILVTAPNEAARNFIRLLIYKKLSFAVLTNSAQEEKKVRRLGVEHIIRMDTAFAHKWALPNATVGRIFLFENSLNLTCRFLQICRPWTRKPITIITQLNHPRGVYRGMGANHIIFTIKGEVGFLLNEDRAAVN
ncbi:hypothetical protein [Paenibacillus sp. Marseille-Q4541]|uniref:hypothetical protein n=1 Tax=Paenibacillus sp. Marseille-Q4541 TaxID=2831522 RepID=UPI001BA8E38B|nr:hypothetical protein [Paenibacillus sp. Marseille-Q4541]